MKPFIPLEIPLDFAPIVSELEYLGLKEDTATRIASVLPALKRAFPLPKVEDKQKLLVMVGEKYWGDRVWVNLLKRDPTSSPHFTSVADSVYEELSSSELWPLVCYTVLMADSAALTPYCNVTKTSSGIAEAFQHTAFNKIRSEVLGETINLELDALGDFIQQAVEAKLNAVDRLAMADVQVMELTEGMQVLTGQFESPSRRFVCEMGVSPAAFTILDESGEIEPVTTYAVVRAYFATDRDYSPGVDADETFGTERSQLRLGSCDVSIPREHRMGELESPSVLRLEFSQNPDKHVVLLKVRVHGSEEFFSAVTSRVKASPRKNAFIFIHGYNVSFEDAARRTGQMAYDLGFDGAPVFYSWPSQAATAKYPVDEANIEWSQANLRGFLCDFLENSQAESIYLIAHSMGSRALTRALTEVLAIDPTAKQRIREVILAAPDIDAEVFARDIVPALAAASLPITLYASKSDLALTASKSFHGSCRAGDCEQTPIVMPPMETIDATKVDSSFLGHSYYGDNRSVLSDMFYILRAGLRADVRAGLQAINTPKGRYWVFKP